MHSYNCQAVVLPNIYIFKPNYAFLEIRYNSTRTLEKLKEFIKCRLDNCSMGITCYTFITVKIKINK